IVRQRGRLPRASAARERAPDACSFEREAVLSLGGDRAVLHSAPRPGPVPRGGDAPGWAPAILNEFETAFLLLLKKGHYSSSWELGVGLPFFYFNQPIIPIAGLSASSDSRSDRSNPSNPSQKI